MQKKLFLCAVFLYTMPMSDINIMNLSKESQEAIEAMKKAEENWDKMVARASEVSGQFQKECQELKVELEELK